jgi:16S rRNA processing protein RimM
LAEILRPRGNRGEVLARSLSDVPGRFESLKSAWAHLADGSDAAVELNTAWQHKGCWVLKFRGIDTIEAAERFRGAELWVRFAERGILSAGEFFQSDLIGCRVVNRETGETAGTVCGWEEYGGPPLMRVRGEGREALIPFVSELCKVDLADRSIRVEIPEGLLELGCE